MSGEDRQELERTEDDGAGADASTRIDAIWAAAPSDDSAGRFLDALLAEGLVCPVWSAQDLLDQQTQAQASGGDGAGGFSPMTVERDGVETFCLFDSVERLEASDLGASEFVAAPGRVFFQLAAEMDAQIAFNPGVAPSDSLFSAETVAMVAALASAGEEEEMVGGGETVEVLSPETPPAEALLAALSARLAAALSAGAPLSDAWLVTIRRADEDGETRARLTLALGVSTGADAESAGLGELARELSRLGGLLAGEGGLDVALLAAGERALAAARRVGLGLVESADAA